MIRQRRHLQLGRHRGSDARQKGANPLDHIDRGGVAVLQDRDEHASVAVLADDIRLKLEPIADAGDITQVDRGAVHLLDRNIG